MSPGNDAAPGGNQGPAAITSSTDKSTPNRRQKPAATHHVAECVEVIGGTGRQRTLLLYRCLLCGATHVCHGRGELPAILERPAACKRGRVALHLGIAEVAA